MNRILIAIVAFVAWTALAFAGGWAWRGDRAEGAEATTQRDAAKAETQSVQGARKTEQASAQTLADIGTQHEEDRREAESVPSTIAADLRAGNLRLRNDLATCHTARLSEAAAAAAGGDAPAQLRGEVAGDLVRVVRDADDQLRACQAVVLADREEPKR